MKRSLPDNIQEFIDWPWEKIEPFYEELQERQISTDNIAIWLSDWSQLLEYVYETFNRLYLNTSIDTNDEAAEQRYKYFLDEILPNSEESAQRLKQKLIKSGIEVLGFEIPLRRMQSEVEIFQEKNLPLLSEEYKLSSEYDRIFGAQTINWDGRETTIEQLKRIYQQTDRSVREKAWRAAAERQLEDRQAVNNLWIRFLSLRKDLFENAGFNDYVTYRWKQMKRFDYTPEDAKAFDQAIEEVVVPIASQIYQKRQQSLGFDSLRPWDLLVDPLSRPPLKPFENVGELERRSSRIFHNVHPEFGDYFDLMRNDNLLDMENRIGKAPGAYCTDLTSLRQPFIFMNAVGIHEDVQTLLHEAGHAFHVFATAELPYIQQTFTDMEFAEVASMAMELLASPYLTVDVGGFYTPEQAARARIEHLEASILFWPYMAVVDLFQHWVYENPLLARDPSNCDREWGELWDRYMPGVDWSGFEEVKDTGWQRKLHIHQMPFYYIEYGLALMGALQVFGRSLQDQAAAVEGYRVALSLGGTVSLPDLFTAAGAEFAFDAHTLGRVCKIAVNTINELESLNTRQ